MNQDIAKLHEVLNQTLDLLDEACELVRPAGVEPSKKTVKLLGIAIGNILTLESTSTTLSQGCDTMTSRRCIVAAKAYNNELERAEIHRGPRLAAAQSPVTACSAGR